MRPALTHDGCDDTLRSGPSRAPWPLLLGLLLPALTGSYPPLHHRACTRPLPEPRYRTSVAAVPPGLPCAPLAVSVTCSVGPSLGLLLSWAESSLRAGPGPGPAACLPSGVVNPLVGGEPSKPGLSGLRTPGQADTWITQLAPDWHPGTCGRPCPGSSQAWSHPWAGVPPPATRSS